MTDIANRRHHRGSRSASASRNWSLTKAKRKMVRLARWADHYLSDHIRMPQQWYRLHNALADAEYRVELRRWPTRTTEELREEAIDLAMRLYGKTRAGGCPNDTNGDGDCGRRTCARCWPQYQP